MKKLVLIGAGSAQFGCITLGDVFQSPKLAGAEIMLLDINAEALKVMHDTATAFVNDNGLDFKISATTDRAEALKGADFVVISIEVGDRFALWDMDWQVPQQYGIKQVYGENGGPGGLFHSLRIVPPILEICGDIMRLCPDAFVFNYSNPMSRICTTVHRKFPDLKFIGMCHEIASLPRYLPGILDRPYKDLEIRAAGLNHFSCLLEAKYRDTGADAYSDIREKAPQFFSTLPGYSELLAQTRKTGKVVETEGGTEQLGVDDDITIRRWSDRRLFEVILDKFNLMPITTDSHFGEYIGWANEVSDHQGILDFYSYYRNYLGTTEPMIELVMKERMVRIIEGIIDDEGYEEYAVNIPNVGADSRRFIKQLPEWIAVEVPAIVDAKGVHGIQVEIPHGFGGLLANQIGIHDLTAEAIVQGSRELVVQALMVDPVVTQIRDLDEMVNVMIDRQRPFLNYLD